VVVPVAVHRAKVLDPGVVQPRSARRGIGRGVSAGGRHGSGGSRARWSPADL